MAVAGEYSLRSRPDSKLLLIALAIAALAHVLFLFVLSILAAAVLLAAKQHTLADLHRLQMTRTNLPAMKEPAMTFVEVDTAVFASEPPKNPKFYAAKNSQAANPDSVVQADVPKIDGTQEHVPKTEDVPRTKAFPLQPAAPKEAAPKEAAPPKELAEAKPPAAPKPGDLTVGKPADSKTETQKQPAKPAPPVSRPLTLAEVEARQKPIIGQKMKQDGGVAKHHPVALDALGTPFGAYDDRIVQAIQQHWYDLLDNESVSLAHTGRVVVEFRLNYDGRVTEMKVVENTVGELLAYLCERAILEPAPYDRWPSDMRLTVGADYREVKFTFYYD